MLYIFVLVIIAFNLTVLEMRICKSSNRRDNLIATVGIFVHHLLQLAVFVTPFTSYFINAPNTVLYFYLFMFIYVLVQNDVINANKVQSCVLSMYTNHKCNLPAESPLLDPVYYIGAKADLHQYKRWYSFIMISYIIYVLILLKYR